MNKVKNWSEKISLRKKWLLFVLALLIGTGAIIGVKPFGTMAMAETFATSEKETYYYVSFQSQTADGHYADLGFSVPFSIHFGNKLTNSDTKKEVASWDETVLSSEMKKVGDMAYLTTKGYKLYARDVVQKLEPSVYHYANLSGAPENADYYLGYSTLGQRTIRQDGQDLDCYTLSYPILKLNRNVQKVKVDYEGALTEETKKAIQENVLAANPNMPMRRVVSMTDQTLSISNIGRDDALTFKVEDLITRVKSEGTTTGEPTTSESTTSEPTTSEPATSEPTTSETPSESTTTPDTKPEEKPTEPAPTEKPADDAKIEELTKERDELQKTIDELKEELDGKNTLNAEQEKKLNDLTGKVDTLQKTLEEAKKACEAKTDSKEKEALTRALDALSKSIDGLEKNVSQLNTQKDKVTTTQPSATTKTPTVNQTPVTMPSASGNTSTKVAQTGGSTSTQGTSSTTPVKTETTSSNASNNSASTGTTENKQEAVIRYPNKLTPKTPANLANSSSGTTGEQPQVTTKGVASDPSKARGTVTENVDNGNKDYPIHHGDGTDAQAVASDGNAVLREQYSADARQFVTFTTKSGKTFHLIINHDEDSENVLLLTEVDEDDLLNMVEKKEEPKVVKEEPVQKVEETQPVKKEEPQPKSNLGTILLMILVVGGVAGAGYYFKVVKAKEKKELEELEEPEDDYYSEAEEPDAESESEEPKENDELL